jgi:hypothetical protein
MATGLFACVSSEEPGLYLTVKAYVVLAHTSEGRYLAKEKTKRRFLFRNLHRWGTQRKTKASKQRRDSTSCHIHSSPSTVLPKTRTTVRIHQNRDPVHPRSTHDLGLNPPTSWRNRSRLVVLRGRPPTVFHDRGTIRSTHLTLAHLPAHITTTIRSPRGTPTDRPPP